MRGNLGGINPFMAHWVRPRKCKNGRRYVPTASSCRVWLIGLNTTAGGEKVGCCFCICLYRSVTLLNSQPCDNNIAIKPSKL